MAPFGNLEGKTEGKAGKKLPKREKGLSPGMPHLLEIRASRDAAPEVLNPLGSPAALFRTIGT
jgi:hypothetical protein